MLVHFLDIDRLDGPTTTDGVDGPIRVAEPDGTIALPSTLECVISKARNSSGSLETLDTYQVGPERELSNDVRGNSCKLLARSPR